jgi:negative regulator of sigma E activity
MSDNKRQLIAAMMDGEALTDEQLTAILGDPQLLATWERYHLASSSIKSDISMPYDQQLSARIAAAVAKLPAHDLQANDIQASEMLDNSPKKAKVIPLFKDVSESLVGFAVAASVTAMMVFGVQQLNTGNPTTFEQPANSYTRTINFPDNQIDSNKPRTAVQELLLDHARESSRYGLQNMLDYVDVVSHTMTIPLQTATPLVVPESKKESEQTDAESKPKSGDQ